MQRRRKITETKTEVHIKYYREKKRQRETKRQIYIQIDYTQRDRYRKTENKQHKNTENTKEEQRKIQKDVFNWRE